MKTDCDKLKESSKYVRKWIVRQPWVKEESITDWLLYNISEKIKRIKYRAFSRHEEARETGADWEWWFIFDGYSFKLRVQAKKIDLGGDNYPSIAQTNKHGLQIEKLLTDSQAKNFLPFYAFYTSNAKKVMCVRQIKNEGVFMAGGKRIYDDFVLSGKKRVTSKNILEKTVALSCMLCCPLCNGHDNGEGFIEFLRRYYDSEIKLGSEVDTQVDSGDRGRMLGYYPQIPEHILSFLKYTKGELPDWWEREFRHYLDDIKALVVYDARGMQKE